MHHTRLDIMDYFVIIQKYLHMFSVQTENRIIIRYNIHNGD